MISDAQTSHVKPRSGGGWLPVSRWVRLSCSERTGLSLKAECLLLEHSPPRRSICGYSLQLAKLHVTAFRVWELQHVFVSLPLSTNHDRTPCPRSQAVQTTKLSLETQCHPCVRRDQSSGTGQTSKYHRFLLQSHHGSATALGGVLRSYWTAHSLLVSLLIVKSCQPTSWLTEHLRPQT